MAAVAGITLAIFIIPFLIAAALILLLVKFIGCAIAPFLGNIVMGGALYFFLDAFHIVKLDWGFFDALIVAVFGVPGTIFLAVWSLL